MFSTTDPTHSVSTIATAAISGTARRVLHRVRLTKVADDGCAAFHVDGLPLRVLCTYAGKGGQR
jgi:Protein of unknown function (DUF1826)